MQVATVICLTIISVVYLHIRIAYKKHVEQGNSPVTSSFAFLLTGDFGYTVIRLPYPHRHFTCPIQIPDMAANKVSSGGDYSSRENLWVAVNNSVQVQVREETTLDVGASEKANEISAGAISELKVIAEAHSSCIISIDGEEAEISSKNLASSMAGRLLLCQYDHRYKRAILAVEVVLSPFRKRNQMIYAEKITTGEWALSGCHRPQVIMTRTLKNSWAGRVLIHGGKLYPVDIVRYLGQDIWARLVQLRL